MSLPERVQRDHHMEELEPSQHLTSPWRRHIHSAAFYHRGMDGVWKFKRLSRPLPQRPEIEIGNVILGTHLILSHRLSSCSMPHEVWNICMAWIVFTVT